LSLYTDGVLFLGLPGPKVDSPCVKNMTDFYKVLPGCDSYLIDSKTAALLFQTYETEKVRFPNNIQLTYAMLKNNLPMQMLQPSIFMDGTKFGLFHSNLELNGRLIFNPSYVALSEHIKRGETGSYTEEDKATIAKLFKECPHKGHLEYYYLKAKYEANKKNYTYALALYKYSAQLCERVGIPMTQGSEFMKDYMKLYKHFQ
jgi:hypothetical protein